MLRLENLEINGFKSFYDPAKLDFPAAMTAVVGPNGCGKSNICDAIIWVLGENRASHIRGETMEDVIFQGSARRRALSMGEVTLTLKTDNGHPASDDGTITLYRGRIILAEAEQLNADAAVAEAHRLESELAERASHHESQLTEVRTAHAEKAERASTIREDLARLTADGERLRSFLQQSEANLRDVMQRLETANEQIASMEQEAGEQQTTLNEKTHALDAARTERNRLREISDQVE